MYNLTEVVAGELPRNLVLANIAKNYRPASLLACRQTILVLSSNGKAKARAARAGWPEAGWSAPRWPEAGWPGAPSVAKRATRGPRE